MNKKELLVFDLDGTLIDTIPDLNAAVNVGLKNHGFPLVDCEHTRKAIGNGVAKLVERSVPEGTSKEVYEDTLKDFEAYYSKHSVDTTYPYEGMYETVKELKAKGYRLAVSTNKLENIAIELINLFYPNIFETVCGDNKVRAKKPAADSINEIKNRLNLHDNSKIVYIGDTEVDYQTSVNSNVDFILAGYGFRHIEELEAKNVPTNVRADKPIDLLNIL